VSPIGEKETRPEHEGGTSSSTGTKDNPINLDASYSISVENHEEGKEGKFQALTDG
jgi:hypothetical protein